MGPSHPGAAALPGAFRRSAVALAYGLSCHTLFVAAIACMAVGLHTGLQSGLGTLHGAGAFAADALLVLQFPLLHSALLNGRGRAWLLRLAPGDLARDLSSTLFAIVASLQLLLAFGLWSPSGVVLYDAPAGAGRTVLFATHVAAWLFLNKAILDGGLALQTGLLGWWAVFRGRRPEFGPLRTSGLFALCRQPIYLGFALVLWTGPTMTLDRLLLAVLWSAYCGFGPRLKERRYARMHGAGFAAYRARVPYLIPRWR
ncbi:MAG: isoprenylcysteine carboxylmethyltransferase family protein [Planctomycetes bacterium]|nr:isoprenylcysteine carboxylmethyltransferase family protein [Planctomycetota bacterium]